MFPSMHPPVLPVHDVVAEIVPQVATLAQALEIEKLVVILVAIYVGCGKYHQAPGDRMRLPILSLAVRIDRRTFTHIMAIVDQHRAPANEAHNKGPFRMIFSVVNWHASG